MFLDFPNNYFDYPADFGLNGNGYLRESTFDFFNDSFFLFSVCIGFLSKLERLKRTYMNDDYIIGRLLDAYYGTYPLESTGFNLPPGMGNCFPLI